jgi:hypothetical protein
MLVKGKISGTPVPPVFLSRLMYPDYSSGRIYVTLGRHFVSDIFTENVLNFTQSFLKLVHCNQTTSVSHQN